MTPYKNKLSACTSKIGENIKSWVLSSFTSLSSSGGPIFYYIAPCSICTCLVYAYSC